MARSDLKKTMVVLIQAENSATFFAETKILLKPLFLAKTETEYSVRH